ncbi:hypothetical protein C8F04DRAFT_1178240 [Mycena alexandri]|uniref:Uncharacterized protein n=1 Tax=Mycena alexandri TaxID=1745969 RepID=A0AAD6T5I5_9AGAR|nr:hypothetical protein C8F04DRAFT_1178240 [Mycena alexandri]
MYIQSESMHPLDGKNDSFVTKHWTLGQLCPKRDTHLPYPLLCSLQTLAKTTVPSETGNLGWKSVMQLRVSKIENGKIGGRTKMYVRYMVGNLKWLVNAQNLSQGPLKGGLWWAQEFPRKGYGKVNQSGH